MKTLPTLAHRHRMEIYNPDKRDTKDRRTKVAFAVFSYITDDGIEYRKGFTAPKNTHEMEFWNIAPKTIEI